MEYEIESICTLNFEQPEDLAKQVHEITKKGYVFMYKVYTNVMDTVLLFSKQQVPMLELKEDDIEGVNGEALHYLVEEAYNGACYSSEKYKIMFSTLDTTLVFLP